jgi:uncharacterized protein (TIGR00251 family)
MQAILEPGDGVLRLRVRAVPGASRDQVAGPLGDRLKIRVAQPPEDGRANRAICELLGEILGIPARQVLVASGQASRDKVIHIIGLGADVVRQRLGIP